MDTVIEIAKNAKSATTEVLQLTTGQKNKILKDIASALINESDYIIMQNKLDLESGAAAGMSKALLDRLTLNKERIKDMAKGVCQIADLDDPIGVVNETQRRPNGLKIGNMCVPLGVVAIIYEARPNVTSDAIALCLKTSNCVILRGGKEAINSNKAIVKIITSAAEKAGLPEGAIGLITDISRESANQLFQLYRRELETATSLWKKQRILKWLRKLL